MPKNIEAFSAKERVTHYVYGLGTISQVNERHTTIVFDENGTRKFLTGVVRLEHSDAAAPVAPARSKNKGVKKKKAQSG